LIDDQQSYEAQLKQQFKRIIKGLARRICERSGYGTTHRPASPTGGGYIEATATEAAAHQAGLTVGDYVEQLWGQEGGAARVIDRIANTGIFLRQGLRVLEIGAGTGRYMEKVFAEAATLADYESYETNSGWVDYLARSYRVTTISHSQKVLHTKKPGDSAYRLGQGFR
jgi:hypothetical protein